MTTKQFVLCERVLVDMCFAWSLTRYSACTPHYPCTMARAAHYPVTMARLCRTIRSLWHVWRTIRALWHVWHTTLAVHSPQPR